jgi:hypothetical protein
MLHDHTRDANRTVEERALLGGRWGGLCGAIVGAIVYVAALLGLI